MATTMQGDAQLYVEISRLNNELLAAQRELTRQNMELERLNREKNQFLGMAAHDLRNPLHSILALSEILRDEDPLSLGESYGELIDTIHATSQFMADLVDDLLDVAKIEAGQLHLDYEPCDLGRLVERNLRRNQLLADRKQIRIAWVIEPLPTAVVDSARLEQALNNMLSNAIKFSPQGSAIQARLERQGERFRLSVQDQGPGLSLDEQANLFSAFQRGRVGTQGEKSSGLGLAIVKRVVEAHGGSLWLKSAPGQGTTISISIPILPKNSESELS